MLCFTTVFAQSNDGNPNKRMDYYGFVVSSDSLHPIRNTHVISKMGHCGTITNQQGLFRIQARSVDTLWVSCIGYARRLIPVDSTIVGHDTLFIRLYPEAITLREVTVMPFSNYETFREMIITMPSIATPGEIARLQDDLDELWLSRPLGEGHGMVTVTMSPIQYFYDKYNASARRQATLRRNRRMYNEVLREQGRTDELLPDSLDFSVEYIFSDDTVQNNNPNRIFENGNPNALVPRRKYFHLGY